MKNNLETAETEPIEVESREFNGRWYTDVKIWRVNNSGTANATPTAAAQKNDMPDVTTFNDDSDGDVLPF